VGADKYGRKNYEKKRKWRDVNYETALAPKPYALFS
jgi:hypothetical protein